MKMTILRIRLELLFLQSPWSSCAWSQGAGCC